MEGDVPTLPINPASITTTDEAVARQASQKLVHLQALRGLAASLVVLCHSLLSLAQRGMIADNRAQRFENSGVFGVVIFFMISGSLSTRPHDDRSATSMKKLAS